MQIFTVRESLHTIKLFENVRSDMAIYQSLLINRGIDISDLYVYLPTITVNSLPHSVNFEYGLDEDITNATEIRFYNLQYRLDNVEALREWFCARPTTQDREGYSVLGIYTEEELDNIAFNLLPENIESQIDIPLKMITILEEVEEKIHTLTIPVVRIKTTLAQIKYIHCANILANRILGIDQEEGDTPSVIVSDDGTLTDWERLSFEFWAENITEQDLLVELAAYKNELESTFTNTELALFLNSMM